VAGAATITPLAAPSVPRTLAHTYISAPGTGALRGTQGGHAVCRQLLDVGYYTFLACTMSRCPHTCGDCSASLFMTTSSQIPSATLVDAN
jgi:hypothetical protein